MADLAAIVGAGGVRPAGGADGIDGLSPAFVVEPGSVEDGAAAVRAASEAGLALCPVGGGSKIGWGGPPERLDVVLSTVRLDRVLEHAAGDLVVRAQAGVRLDDLQRELASAGQTLALDPAEPDATLGGIVAAGASGPRRLRFGTPRDLLIGVTVVLADGSVTKAGGKVVKNVAGYDLGKLYAGSFGTLGLICEVIFRLHPLPAARRLVTAEVGTPEAAWASASRLSATPLVPSAVELSWPAPGGPGNIAALFEGIEAGVESQAARAAEALGRVPATGAPDVSDGTAWDGTWAARWPERGDDGPGDAWLGVKLTHPPASLGEALRATWDAGSRGGLRVAVRSHAAVGVCHAAFAGGGDDACALALGTLRAAAAARGGSAVALKAEPGLKRRLDVWGPAGDVLPLMRRVKERFDPGRTFSPGRFLGGI